jgi:hypothetical protein
MEIVYVKGWVPKAFFDWLECQTGQDRHEAKMLGRCYLEEVETPAPAVLFGWLEGAGRRSRQVQKTRGSPAGVRCGVEGGAVSAEKVGCSCRRVRGNAEA